MICGAEEARSARKAIRVSVESLTPTDIDPTEQISVVFRVENYGQVSVILPVSPRITDLLPENDSDHYSAYVATRRRDSWWCNLHGVAGIVRLDEIEYDCQS